MKTKTKRGRPPKGQDRVKADYLDIRLGSSEKTTFKDAAELAGLDLSAWVRERLRAVARRELAAAGLPVAFLAMPTNKASGSQTMDGRPDHLISARYERPSRVRLAFADGLNGAWSFRQLELDMNNMKLATMKASASGNAMEVRSKWNERVQIDSSSLRAMVDPAYAADLERAFLSLRGPLENLKATAVSLPKK